MSYARFSTDDRRGVMRGYTGAGQFHRRSSRHLRRCGRGGDSSSYRKLLKYICREAFEHHVAANFSDVSKAIHEAAH
jgi:hypothetical protein